MKLRKSIQWVLEVVFTISLILIMTTIESEWCFEYLLFLFINVAIVIGVGFTLNKYGRWE